MEPLTPGAGPESVEPDDSSASPTWAELTALPPKAPGTGINLLGLTIVVGGLIIVALLAGLVFVMRSEQGKVMFTTTDPNGGNSCVVTNQVTTISQGTHAWMVAVFTSPIGDQTITVQVTKNNVYVWSYTWPIETARGGNCTWGPDMATYEPGRWTFAFSRDGKVEESGTLTIN